MSRLEVFMHLRQTASRIVLPVGLLACALLAGAPRAEASNGQARVSFGDRIVVGSDETADDLVCFFCSVESQGKINGDVVTFFGNVKATNAIEGNLVSFGGDVNLSDAASVNGDLVVFGGAVRRIGETRVGGDQVIFPAIIFAIPLLIIGGIIWGVSALFRRRAPHFYVPPAR